MRRTLGAVLACTAAFACRPAAPSGLTLLFLNRSPAAVIGGRSWAPDPDHSRIVVFDARLRPVASLTGPHLASPMAVAALGDYLLVSEQTGEGVVLDTTGAVVREWESPFPVALYAASGDRVIAARSPYRVPQLVAEPSTAPLLRVLDTLGRPLEGLATIHVPPTPFLTQITNAGAVTADGGGDAIYYAPLARDEIVKYDRSGARRWITTRRIYPHESEPVFLPASGRELHVAQALVNVALVLGPDGRLYVLGADDSAATALRVDVLDTATGAIVTTRKLGPGETAVAVDARGRLVTFDATTLLAWGPGTSEREPFAPAFALPDSNGDTVTLAHFVGKVTLVNFWASWCDPCREEFPHMGKLYRTLDRRDFAIVAISDDVDRGKMLAFVREFRPPFPILVGGGRMKQTYRYRGLPYSLLLDRQGRVIERIFGFGGAAEFQRLSMTIAKEIAGR